MNKRILAGLTAILVILALASCKGRGKEPIPPQETGAPVASPASPDATPVSPGATPASPGATPVTPGETTPPVTPPSEITPPDGLKDELAGLWERIDGSTATIPLTAAIYDTIQGGSRPPVHFTTPDAYYRLIYKENTDLIFVTYPSENEFDMARANGVELEIIPVTKDALVFLVNAENPVSNIPLTKLRDVYSGKITNWKSLGGDNEDIIPYQRSADSGSQTLFLKLLMAGATPMDPPSGWAPESMGMLVESVSDYDNSKRAIGYSVFYYVNNMYGNSRFKLLSIDGVKPSRETITRGEYPLEDFYYAVMRKDTPADAPARKLVDWVLTDDGQRLAVRAGYIPLRPVGGAAPDDDIDPIYLGDTDSSSGTGGTVLKTGVEDVQPVNGVRPPLSDLFFDGFNYISYINGELMDRLNWVDYENWIRITLGESILIRPFTGIPNDYPNYEINYMGALFISFPEGNPFFGQGTNLYVTLTEDISPYGVGLADYAVRYDYGRRLMSNVDLYTLSLGIPGNPEAAARINERLNTWTDGLPADGDSARLLEGFTKWYAGGWASDDWAYRLQPMAGWRDNYISVSYLLQTYDGPSFNMPMVYTISFDVRSGEIVDLAGALSGSLDYSGAQCYTLADFEDLGDYGYPRQEYLPDGYSPAPGSVTDAAWIAYGALNVSLTEPNGRQLQFIFWED